MRSTKTPKEQQAHPMRSTKTPKGLQAPSPGQASEAKRHPGFGQKTADTPPEGAKAMTEAPLSLLLPPPGAPRWRLGTTQVSRRFARLPWAGVSLPLRGARRTHDHHPYSTQPARQTHDIKTFAILTLSQPSCGHFFAPPAPPKRKLCDNISNGTPPPFCHALTPD